MKKGITGLISIGTLILMLGLATGEIGADWRIGGFGGYYAPRFGEVNEWDEWYEETEIYGVELNLRGGTIFGATARYDIGLSGCGKKNAT